MATSKVSLKFLIDKKGHKVIFAEAGKDFVDFLLYLLNLPLGTVIRLLTEQDMVGCLGNLYKSFNELDESYIRTSQIRESILKPTVSISPTEIPLLLLSDELPSKLYRCQYCNKNVAKEPNVACSSCSARGHGRWNVLSNEKGFVKGVVTYMVMDNLEVSPMSSISSITLLNQFKIQDLSVLEERVVDLGMDEALKLLKEPLQSNTVLTRVFLGTMKKLGCYKCVFVFFKAWN
ncbi:hypothetical protein P3X46_014196 [Hevea brasiliensis]|uniref:DUF674 domain-containing protein n=1 Tax=Hevea brasiliensis TaxID=3981 RepID=A0ABQ9M633_HEVBR|nr:uncharacterized protein LOC131182165 [Hevea brasiliensis]KAJ9175661.1 hypothetical protein P3X46_014196 [Hevea brasiliensis]